MNGLNRIALVIGYAVLALAAAAGLFMLWDKILIWALTIVSFAIIGPVVFVLSFFVVVLVASVLALPARPFMDADTWERLVAGMGFVLWVALGLMLTLTE